jgi:hypothetical protein
MDAKDNGEDGADYVTLESLIAFLVGKSQT